MGCHKYYHTLSLSLSLSLSLCLSQCLCLSLMLPSSFTGAEVTPPVTDSPLDPCLQTSQKPLEPAPPPPRVCWSMRFTFTRSQLLHHLNVRAHAAKAFNHLGLFWGNSHQGGTVYPHLLWQMLRRIVRENWRSQPMHLTTRIYSEAPAIKVVLCTPASLRDGDWKG